MVTTATDGSGAPSSWVSAALLFADVTVWSPDDVMRVMRMANAGVTVDQIAAGVGMKGIF